MGILFEFFDSRRYEGKVCKQQLGAEVDEVFGGVGRIFIRADNEGNHIDDANLVDEAFCGGAAVVVGEVEAGDIETFDCRVNRFLWLV